MPAALLVACAVALASPRAQPREAEAVAITNATILTVTQGTIPNGTIVLRNGRIEAIGPNVPIPQDAEVVDGTGKFVTPGTKEFIRNAARSVKEGLPSATALRALTLDAALPVLPTVSGRSTKARWPTSS